MSTEERVASAEARLDAINGSQERQARATEKLADRVETLAVEVAEDRAMNKGEHKATRKEMRFAGALVAIAVIGSAYLPGAHGSPPAKAVGTLLRLL
jgi:hypothetical protein